MSSQSAGRRRSNMRQYSAEDQALNMISKEAESRLAAKRAARAEAREIRLKEMEKQQRESEAKQDRVYELTNEHNAVKSRQLSGSRSGSRRGSTESNESEPKDVDFKLELRELEEKYKAAMMTSAQLDNEKQSLVYQVELLKDQLEEQDEGFTELQRQYKDKCRDYDFQKRDLQSMEHELNILKQQLEIKDRLIEESGFVILSNDRGEPVLSRQTSGSSSTNGPLPSGAVLVSQETKDFLEKAGGGTLDEKIKTFAAEQASMRKEIKSLKSELEDHQLNAKKGEYSSSGVSQSNGPELQLYEIQREYSKQIHDYKFKLQKAEQDIATLEGMVTRLETQVKRYKSDAERAEGAEDELKQEKRKLQKELREALTHVEELQNQNKHLNSRIERIRQTRAALGVQ